MLNPEDLYLANTKILDDPRMHGLTLVIALSSPQDAGSTAGQLGQVLLSELKNLEIGPARHRATPAAFADRTGFGLSHARAAYPTLPRHRARLPQGSDSRHFAVEAHRGPARNRHQPARSALHRRRLRYRGIRREHSAVHLRGRPAAGHPHRPRTCGHGRASLATHR